MEFSKWTNPVKVDCLENMIFGLRQKVLIAQPYKEKTAKIWAAALSHAEDLLNLAWTSMGWFFYQKNSLSALTVISELKFII